MRAIAVRGVRLAAIPLVAAAAVWGGLAPPVATAQPVRALAPAAGPAASYATGDGPTSELALLHAARRAEAKAFAAHEHAARASRTLVRPSAPGAARLLGERMSAARGWTGVQFSCLDAIWTNESAWSVTAVNATSGSYGIPQAQPGYKMAAAGSGWRTDAATQIAWGLWYIGAAYGNPCSAWAFWQTHNWY